MKLSARLVRPLGVAMFAGLVIAVSTSGAYAAVASVLRTVDIPAGARCNGTTGGTAVAVVNGSRVGVPQSPILLVTSCLNGTQATLYFIDASNASLGWSLNTLISPTAGWAALAYRGDKGDILACTVTGATTTDIYTIKVNAFETAPVNGTAVKVAGAVPGSSCLGFAWDPNNGDGKVYQGAASGAGVLKYSLPTTPGATPTVSTPASSGCPANVAGLAVAGQSLFVSCPPPSGQSNSTIRQIDKNNFATLVRSFPGPTTNPVGFAADPVSFGGKFLDALWTKDQSAVPVRALEIPGGTTGQVAGVPVPFPAACPDKYPTAQDGTALDTDADGILDCWEDPALWSDGVPGINFTGAWVNGVNATTLRHLTLCVDQNANNSFGTAGSAERIAECAGKSQKDLFVEYDYMKFHSPLQTAVLSNGTVVTPAAQAITNVIAAFANAPTPIRLHVQLGEEVPHADTISLSPCTAPGGAVNFDSVKSQFFGTATERTDATTTKPRLNARAFTFRYGLGAHNQPASTSTGCAEVGGNDFLLTLGSWGTINVGTLKAPVYHGVGTLDQQQGTFMHELGHTLGLLHGGGDHENCKPNYLSVMNYPRQISQSGFPRPLDYSRSALPTLNETSLNEAAGIGGVAGQQTMFGPPTGFPLKPTIVGTDGAINWDRDTSSTETVSQEVSALGISGCPAPGTAPASLVGFNDWANLKFNFRASVDFAAGVALTHVPEKEAGTLELDLDEGLVLSPDVIDFKPADPNNLVKVNTTQTVSVAIFSRAGEAPLDATTIDPATVVLRSKFPSAVEWVVPVKRTNQGTFLCNTMDINKDGLPDFQCQFDLQKQMITADQTAVILEGQTTPDADGVVHPILSSHFIKPN